MRGDEGGEAILLGAKGPLIRRYAPPSPRWGEGGPLVLAARTSETKAIAAMPVCHGCALQLR